MKLKYVVLLSIALIAAGGAWAARILWRVHRQLVTLNVREMPLADVLHKIERQTWTKIRAEKALNTRITLHVQNQPLSEVLDRLAEQAGARWCKISAVYDSKPALERLESALRTSGKLEPAGWLRLAPNLPPPNFEPGKEGGPGPAFKAGPGAAGEGHPMVMRRFRSAPDGGPQEMGVDQRGEPSPPEGAPPMLGPGRVMMARRGQNGPVVFTMGGDGQTEMWSPEELVMDSSLTPRLGGQTNESATAQSAADTAQKVTGQWTTYLAFKKSIMGVGFGPPPQPGMGPLHHSPNERFARLTPEQRVQQARQRMGLEDRPEPGRQ